jgi:hypothetical protein
VLADRVEAVVGLHPAQVAVADAVDQRTDEVGGELGVPESRHGAGEVVVEPPVVGIEEQRPLRPFPRAVLESERAERRDEEAEGAAVVRLVGENALAAGEHAPMRGRRRLAIAQRLVRLRDHARGPVGVGLERDRALEVLDGPRVLAARDRERARDGQRVEAVRVEGERLLEKCRGGLLGHLAADPRLRERRISFRGVRIRGDCPLRRCARARERVAFDPALAHLGFGDREQRPAPREAGIELHHAAADADDDGLQALAALALEAARDQEELVGLRVVRGALLERLALRGQQAHLQRRDDGLRDLVLDREDVVERPVEALGPERRIGGGVEELRGDPDPVAGLADAALHHVGDAEVARELRGRDGLSLVRERGIARGDREPGDAREVRDDVLGHAIGEVFLLGVAAHVHEGQDRYAGPAERGDARDAGRRRPGAARRGPGVDQPAGIRGQREPGLVVPAPAPVRELDAVHQLEGDRSLAGRDDHRQQRPAAVRERRLGAHPARGHGMR